MLWWVCGLVRWWRRWRCMVARLLEKLVEEIPNRPVDLNPSMD
jgi:hypothetical protein